MPQGFGYGAIGKIISSLQSGVGRYAKEAVTVGAPGASVARYFSNMSQAGVGATLGGLTGAVYGAMSDDTGMLGGAMTGAAVGFGGLSAYRGLARYGGRYMKARARGAGRGTAMEAMYGAILNDTRNLMGSARTSAINPIMSSLKGFRNRF